MVVDWRESGNCFSSIDLLKSVVRIGERKGVKSFKIAGFILEMSLALLMLMFFIIVSTCSCVTCVRWKVGLSVFCMCSFGSYFGIVSFVFRAIVM